MMRFRTLVVLFLSAAPALAQAGNLVTVGRFDSAADVAAWTVLSPQYSDLDFEATPDADQCDGSGNATATSNPSGDGGTAEYRLCLGPTISGAAYRIGGAIRFPSAAVDGYADVILSFFPGTTCTGTVDGGVVAGYAQSSINGWQRFTAGPIVPAAGQHSAMIRLLLTSSVGSQPMITARFDEIQVSISDPVFADDFDLGEACRWSVVQP